MRVAPITVIYKPIYRRKKPEKNPPLRVEEQKRTDAPNNSINHNLKGIL